MSRLTLIFTAASLLLVAACATNPVTGDKELAFVSESTELEIGRQQYGPSRQMQGGDFNADPELTAYVSEVGQRLAAVSDRKLPYEFVVLNNSVPNAWALPGGKIAVNRGLLLELDNEAELAAVLGHEVVHSAARHGAKGMERGMLLQGAVTAAGMAASVATDDPGYAAIAVGSATLAANLINQRYGRDAEREADLYGMEYMARAGYDLNAAVTLQETFERLSSERRQDWLSGLFASHPPSQERVENNKVTARRRGVKGGKVGREPYQQAIAHLKKTKPAYDAYEEGVSRLKAADLEEARRLATRALKTEPREARFHALLGDADFARKDYKKALEHYDRALAQDPRYFAFYLQRGLTKRQLGDLSGAKEDLAQSVKLLPTVESYNVLGQLALAEGDRAQAKDFFRQAAGSETGPGREALRSLTELDLPDNPNRYLKVRLGANQRGDLLAYLANPTHLTLRDVRLVIRYRDPSGRMRELTRILPGRIGAGQKRRVDTGLGPVTDPKMLGRLQVTVDRAQIE